jgi:hypothetical protein
MVPVLKDSLLVTTTAAVMDMAGAGVALGGKSVLGCSGDVLFLLLDMADRST